MFDTGGLSYMRPSQFTLLAILALAGCGRDDREPSGKSSPGTGGGEWGKATSLTEARRGFKSKLVQRGSDKEPVAEPPARLFRTVRYDSPVGKLAAYLTPDPKDG